MPPPTRSRVFAGFQAIKQHLMQITGGIAAEIYKLRDDTEAAFLRLQDESGGPTASRLALAATLTPEDRGLQFYDTDLNTLFSWDGSAWQSGAAPTGSAGGDLSGSYPNPTVSALNTYPIDPTPPANGDALLFNSVTGKYENTAITFGGGPPAGAAGGSLAGLYPNPTLSSVGSAGTYGDAATVPVVTTTSEGRVSAVTPTTIAITESQVTGLTGNLAAKADKTTSVSAGSGLTGGGDLSADRTIAMPAVGTSGTYGDAATVPVLSTDTQGRVSSVTPTAIAITQSQVTGLSGNLAAKADKTTSISAGTGLSGGGDLSTDRTISMPNVGVAGSYGSASSVPAFSTDAQGRVTSTTNTPIQITEAQVTGLGADLSDKADKITTITAGSGLTGGGDLSANRTIAMPSIGVPGNYGSASDIPVITTDSQGRVSGVLVTPVQVAETQVTGLVSDLAGKVDTTRLVNTTNGLTGGGDLAADRTLSPVYGTLANTITEGNDPRLSDARVPTGPAGGDLSGTYPNPSLASIQGNAISALSPNTGETLIWNGSAWVNASPGSGGGGGGGSGITYFFNNGTLGQSPVVGLFGTPAQFGTQAEASITTVTSGNLSTGGVYNTIASFVTDVSVPGITSIPAGLWDVNIWASCSDSNPQRVFFRVRVYKYDGTTKTQLFLSDPIGLFDPTTIWQYNVAFVVPVTALTVTDRIYVELEATATVGSRTITFSFGGTTPSHAHTTLPAVAGTGLVHVINGVLQSPASPVNFGAGSSEIVGVLPATNGGTGQSAYTIGDLIYASTPTALLPLNDVATGNVLLSGGANTAPLYGKVGLTTHVSGVLPVVNGGTGNSAVPSAGQLLIGTGSQYTAATLTAGSGIGVSNGVGSITLSNTGVLTVGASSPILSSGGPNPVISLDVSGVSAGVYGAAGSVPTLTVTSQGLIALASNTPIQIAESQVTNLTSDLAGKVPITTSIFAGTGLTGGGDLSADRTISMPNVGTAGVYGSASKIPVFTTDAQGRVTLVTPTSVALDASQITSGTLPILRGGTGLSTAGGTANRAFYTADGSTFTTGLLPNAALANNTITANAGTGLSTTGASIPLGGSSTLSIANTTVAAGSYGAANTVGTFTVNAQGQLTAAANAPIAITASQVTSGTFPAGVSVQNHFQSVTSQVSGGNTPLAYGEVVYLPNGGGNASNPAVDRAVASAGSTSLTTIGLVASTSIPNAGTGNVITQGILVGNPLNSPPYLNTNGFSQGDILYVDPTTPGALTNVKPSYPNVAIAVGIVLVKNQYTGAIYVNPTVSADLAPVVKMQAASAKLTLSSGITSIPSSAFNGPPAVEYLALDFNGGGSTVNLNAGPIAALTANDYGRRLTIHNVSTKDISFSPSGTVLLTTSANLAPGALLLPAISQRGNSSLVSFVWSYFGGGVGKWLQVTPVITVG